MNAEPVHRAVDRIAAELADDLHDAIDEADASGWGLWQFIVDGVLETAGELLYELEGDDDD